MLVKSSLLILSLIFALLFYIFTVLVKKDHLRQFDFDYLVKIQDRIPLDLVGPLSFFNTTGKFEFVLVFLVLLVVFLLLHKRFLSFVILFVFVFGHVIELFGKSLLDQHGPPFMFYQLETIREFPIDYVNPGSSYPSGHSFRAAFIFTILACLFSSRGRLASGQLSRIKGNFVVKVFPVLLVGSWAGLVIISKVALGEHWPTDIIGGALLGVALGFFSLLFL